MGTELQTCPRCDGEYPEYHAIDEGGFLCEFCGYWSADPEPVNLRIATHTEGFKLSRERALRGESDGN